MPLQIVRNDITHMKVDAIVNAAKPSLLGGGGVDGAIHAAAGPELLEECMELGGCETGQAKLTGAGRLPCRYVIHTVGPIWCGGGEGEEALLTSCYRSSLELAVLAGCDSVAFPLISSGAYGYPKDKALRVAVNAISAFLMEHELTVYIVIFDRNSYQIGRALFADIASYIDDHYAAARAASAARRERQFDEAELRAFAAKKPGPEPRSPWQRLFRKQRCPRCSKWIADDLHLCPHCGCPLSEERTQQAAFAAAPLPDEARETSLQEIREMPEWLDDACAFSPPVSAMLAPTPTLEEMLQQVDESFSQMLLRKIDERGMTDVQCYKRANISRKLFSKIRSDPLYRPSKPTALAFAIALELPLEETRDLLGKAGFALSRSSKFDIIVEYFITRQNYNIFEINEALFAFDQSLLGAS